MPEERLLQEVLQPEGQEVTGDWREMRYKELHENCAGLRHYAASSGNCLRTLRDNLLDPRPLKTGPIDCPETSVRKYHNSLRNDPEERSSLLLRGGSLKSRRRTS